MNPRACRKQQSSDPGVVVVLCSEVIICKKPSSHIIAKIARIVFVLAIPAIPAIGAIAWFSYDRRMTQSKPRGHGI